MFSPTSIELCLSFFFCLLLCLPWSPWQLLCMWCAACPCADACMTVCIVRIQCSGNELLKTGLWAHDITNSLNFTAKTNSGSCFGLCCISLPPWLRFSFTWKSLLKFVPKEAGGRGLTQRAVKLECSRLGNTWWNVAKGEWFLTAKVSSSNHQWEAMRICGLQKYFTLGFLGSEVMSEDRWREKLCGH